MIAQPVADALSNFEVQAITIGGGILIAAIAASGAAAVLYLKKKLGMDDKNQATAAIESAIQNGLNKGVMDAVANIKVGGERQNTSTIMFQSAMQYAAPKIKGELERAGIDPATLPERIAARRDGKLLEPAVTEALNTASLDAAKKANAPD